MSSLLRLPPCLTCLAVLTACLQNVSHVLHQPISFLSSSLVVITALVALAAPLFEVEGIPKLASNAWKVAVTPLALEAGVRGRLLVIFS